MEYNLEKKRNKNKKRGVDEERLSREELLGGNIGSTTNIVALSSHHEDKGCQNGEIMATMDDFMGDPEKRRTVSLCQADRIIINLGK